MIHTLLQAMIGLGMALFVLAGVLVLLAISLLSVLLTPGRRSHGRRIFMFGLLLAIVAVAALMFLLIILNSSGDAAMIN